MLNVEQLTKKLPDGRALLNGISFRVARGEFVGVLGASGAGKSLTLRCILGLTQADGGTATLQANDGQTFELTTCKGRCQREARRRMGVIFQGFNLVKRLRVIDNVMIGRLAQIHPLRSWLYGFTDAEAAEALEALRRVKMEKYADRITGSLSGGEMQRVAIARAVFQKPSLYLADEPIASLDPESSALVMDLLTAIARTERATLLVSLHQLDVAVRACERVIALRDGRICFDGPSSALNGDLLHSIYGGRWAEVLRNAEPAVAPAPILVPSLT